MTDLYVDDHVYTTNSSSIKSVGYNSNTGVLAIEFHNGSAVGYQSVPPSVFDYLVKSESAGTYYNRYIKDKYRGFSGTNHKIVKIEKTVAPVVREREFDISYTFDGKVTIKATDMDAALTKFNKSAEGQTVKIKSVTVNFDD